MKAIAKQLEAIIDNVLVQLNEQDLNAWSEKADPQKWSKKELWGHLLDSAYNNLQRFVRATYDENFRFNYDQNEWVEAQHYQEVDLQEMITLWKLLNKQIVRVLTVFPEERKHILIDTGKPGPDFYTLEFIANDYIGHLKHHLKQLALDKAVASEG